MIVSCHLQTQFRFLLFISSSIAIARAFKTILNENGKSEHPCLVSDLRGNAFRYLSMRLAVGLSYMALIMLS